MTIHPTLFFLSLLVTTVFAEPAFKVEIDFTAAPQCEAFAKQSKTITEEWYPKINEILFGKDHPLPVPVVHLKFEPMKGVAHATNDGIHISADWITKHPDDKGMVVHELTHVVQGYPPGGPGWLVEGIADYVRLTHYEPHVPRPKLDPDKASYKDAYKTTAMFLEWIENTKGKGLVVKLNAALRQGAYREVLFQEITGKLLDDLWNEFADSLRQKPR